MSTSKKWILQAKNYKTHVSLEAVDANTEEPIAPVYILADVSDEIEERTSFYPEEDIEETLQDNGYDPYQDDTQYTPRGEMIVNESKIYHWMKEVSEYEK